MPGAEITRERFPGYDVLAKRDTPSWDEPTRQVIDARLRTPLVPQFFTAIEWDVADALCRRIVALEDGAGGTPLVALLDAKLLADHGDGFRESDMPYMPEAWRAALAALDAEARARRPGHGFAQLAGDAQDELLTQMQRGGLDNDRWAAIDAKKFFERRVLVDVPALYYGHPAGWNAIGFGGPASPRGYVRLDGNRRDPWDAAEGRPGHEQEARRLNRHVV